MLRLYENSHLSLKSVNAGAIIGSIESTFLNEKAILTLMKTLLLSNFLSVLHAILNTVKIKKDISQIYKIKLKINYVKLKI